MTANQKRLVIRISAVVVIVAIVAGAAGLLRVAPLVIVAVIGGVVVVLVAMKIRAYYKTRTIFGFYVAANQVLVNGEGNRYRFEVTKLIKKGQKVVRSMPDAPPLSRFALGALYYSVDDHNGAVEQLGFAAEEEVLKESRHLVPSRQLRRYVEKLRKIERKPKRGAAIIAAMASLERMHQQRGARLLAESQQQLKRLVESYSLETPPLPPVQDRRISNSRTLDSITAPPPISQVLNDIYQEDNAS